MLNRLTQQFHFHVHPDDEADHKPTIPEDVGLQLDDVQKELDKRMVGMKNPALTVSVVDGVCYWDVIDDPSKVSNKTSVK